MKKGLKEYLGEKRLTNRLFILLVALTGIFIGAILMFFMALVGIVL